MESFLDDLKYSLRTLLQNPGFVLTALTILALGIGANIAVFTLINTIFLRGYPGVDPENRLVYIREQDTRQGWGRVSYPDILDFRDQAKSFDGLSYVQEDGIQVNIADQNTSTETYYLARIGANAFRVLGQRPILGRDFTSDDDRPGATPVAILTYTVWERRFGKAPAILGKIVRIDGVPTTVVGVMPAGFVFPTNVDLWMPTAETANLHRRDWSNLYFAFGRLASGATLASARAEVETIGHRLAIAYPETNRDCIPVLETFQHFFGQNAAMIYGSLFGAVAFLLLIACANTANLMLARSMRRSRELSLRIALGAGRWRIIRLLLLESMMISGLGGVLAWPIAKWGLQIYEFASVTPGSYPRWHYSMDARVCFYSLAISMIAGLMFGVSPAMLLSKLDINNALKDGGRAATGGRRGRRLSNLLVTAEMALALILLAGAGVMVRSVLNLDHTNIGIDPSNILEAHIEVQKEKYPRAQSQSSFYERVQEQLKVVPGVESVAISDAMPTYGSGFFRYELAGAATEESSRPTVPSVVVGPTYFQTLRGTLLMGRNFGEADDASGVPVAIVNQSFANQCWPGQVPVGKRFRPYLEGKPGSWITVVGVVGNIVQGNLIQYSRRGRFDPVVYLPVRQVPRMGMYVFLRSRVSPESLTVTLWRQVHSLDPDAKISGPFVLTQRMKFTYWGSRVNSILFLTFAGIALLLASLGLYAVVAYSMTQRTQEIGIRLAVGATGRDVLKLVFLQATSPLGIGLGIGIIGSMAVNRTLTSQLVLVSASDPITMAVASGVLILAAILGCWIPARRAMRVDPLVALRHD